MKRFHSLLALVLALALVMGLAACGTSNKNPNTDSPAPSSSGSNEGNTENTSAPDPTPEFSSINLSTYDMYAEKVEKIEPTLTIDIGTTNTFGNNFNPVGENGTLVSENLRMLVYDFLWTYDGDNGNAASSRILQDWYQEDDTTFVMVLRPGITFRTKDGVYAEMTGEDILFSMESYVTQNSVLGSDFSVYNYETSYVSEDGLTVYLKSDKPYGPSVRTIPIICKQWVEENGWDSEKWVSDPCGSGPYTSGEFVSGSSISVVLRDSWWNEDYRQTPVKEFVLHLYNEVSTMYIDLEMGSIDLAICIASADYDRAMNGESPNVAVEKTSSGKMWFLGLGGSQEQNQYLADPKVREAIAHAVDWNAVAEASFGSLYQPVTGIVSPNSSYYTEGLVEQYTYDPDLARSILKEAGYSDGEIVFNNVNFGPQATLAEAIQFYLSDVGITMNIETFDFLTALFSWMGTGEPACDTAFNDQTDASNEPCDNLRYYSYDGSQFPVLVADDEQWNEMFMQFKYSKENRQGILDEMVTYVHDNHLFFPIGICADSFAYRTDVISDVNLFSTTQGGPDFGLISYVGY